MSLAFGMSSIPLDVPQQEFRHSWTYRLIFAAIGLPVVAFCVFMSAVSDTTEFLVAALIVAALVVLFWKLQFEERLRIDGHGICLVRRSSERRLLWHDVRFFRIDPSLNEVVLEGHSGARIVFRLNWDHRRELLVTLFQAEESLRTPH